MEILNLIGQKYSFQPHGHLYVKQDPDQTYIPNYAKTLDVGLDLPVKISIDKAKFAKAGETISKLRNAMLYPDLRHYIKPEGSSDDPIPWLEVPSMGWAEVPSGLSVKLPDDAWGLLTSRSSTIWKLHLISIPSNIDIGYIGQLGMLVHNPNNYPVRVHEYNNETKTGDKLGQLILIPVYRPNAIILVDKLPNTDRGSTGFGSTTGLYKITS
jgi:dUTPase